MGGGMLRIVGQAVGAGLGGVHESISTVRPKPTSLLSVASPSSSVSLPVSATSTVTILHPSVAFVDNDEWEAVDADDAVTGFSERFVFGAVPSKEEVEDVVSALQQVFASASYTEVVEDGTPSAEIKGSADQPTNSKEGTPSAEIKGSADQPTNSTDLICHVSSAESKSNEIEPLVNVYDIRELQSRGFNHAFDAFRLLQSNPTVQRMVVSLSSDKAVWDAVMSNEAVQELRQSFCQAARKGFLPSYEESPQDAMRFLTWILENMKAKIMELMDKITTIVKELFKPPSKEKAADIFEDMVTSSLMLSIMVLLVVVVARVQNI